MKNLGRGEILLSLCYQPAASRVTVVVLKARNLPKMDITGLSGKHIKLNQIILQIRFFWFWHVFFSEEQSFKIPTVHAYNWYIYIKLKSPYGVFVCKIVCPIITREPLYWFEWFDWGLDRTIITGMFLAWFKNS